MTIVSRGRLSELGFEAFVAGVPGEPCRGVVESILGRSLLETLNMPPKLLRPVVAVEALPDNKEGVERRSSSLSENAVVDRSRPSIRAGGARAGVERVECAECVLPCRRI